MGLITTEVEVELNGRNIKYYEDKGYIIPKNINKNGKETFKRVKIIVKVKNLQDGSTAKVNIECDKCGELLEGVSWNNYKRGISTNNGKYYCKACSHGYRKSISFYDWCYTNLSKEIADIIMLRWDYELNIDKNGKKLSPKDVSHSSHGINNRKNDGKGYWFKCLDHPEHKSELKYINAFTGGQKGSLDCAMCKIIFNTHPYLVHFFVNKEDAYKYSYGSFKKALVKCPECGYEKDITIAHLVKHGFGCNRCGDGISFPEKVLFNVLEQLNIHFKSQLAKTTFKWCDKYRYDFYINKINGICEVHGIQHYEETSKKSKWNTLKYIQENDNNKKLLAMNNGISNYIIINCSHSNIEWIKNNIMGSELPELLNFKEEDIDWVECNKFACNSLVRVVCDLWNSGIKDINKIIDKLEFKLSDSTVRRYLKKGMELNWCNYNKK